MAGKCTSSGAGPRPLRFSVGSSCAPVRTSVAPEEIRERFREMGGARTVYYAGLVDHGRPVAAWPTSRTQQRGVALCDLGAAPLLPPGAAAQRSHLRGGMSGEYYFRQTDPRGGHQPPPLQDRPSGGGTGRPAKLCSSRGFVRGGKQDKGTRAADTRLNREYRSGYAIFSGKCSGGCPKEAEVPPPPMRQRTPRGSPMPRPRRAPRPRMQALATGGGGR